MRRTEEDDKSDIEICKLKIISADEWTNTLLYDRDTTHTTSI